MDDNSFELFSTMSAKMNQRTYNILRKKALVPTKLALKRNIRRSSAFDSLRTTGENSSLILVEDSSSDSSTKPHLGFNVINSTVITVSDSDSSESENCTNLKKTDEIPGDCGLSQSKYCTIGKWVANVQQVKATYRRSIELQRELMPNNSAENLNIKRGFCKENNVPISTPIADNDVHSSSDIIEGSDDSGSEDKLHVSLLDELYGNSWKNRRNILFPQSEPRNWRKRGNIAKALPKTEIKLKPKHSIIYKNPYLDAPQTPSMPKKAIEPPWSRRLQALCDSDTSENSNKEVSQKPHRPVAVRLAFGDDNKDGIKENPCNDSEKENGDNKDEPNFGENSNLSMSRKIEKRSVNLEKINWSDFSDDETLEDKLRRKLNLGGNTNIPISKKNDAKKGTEKRNLERESFGDISENYEPLKERLRKKLGLEEETKRLISSDLQRILNTKNDNFENRVVSTNEVVRISDKDLKTIKTGDKPAKKKNRVKTKVQRKKVISSSEDSDSVEIVSTAIDHKRVVVKDAQVSSDGVKSFLASLSGCVPIFQCDPSARIFRNSFKMYKNNLVSKLFKLYNEEIFNKALPEDTLIEWSERMRGSAGFCYCKKITRSTGLIERKARIVLSSKVLDCADRVRDTLIHEMCHAATWIINEVSDGHGCYWKSWAHKARQTFPELPPIKVCHNYAIATKYTYKCTKCSYSFGRHSKSLDIERKRCGYCYGTFEILINKKTKNGETKSVPTTPKKQVTGFALFVKENYAVYKSPQLNHGQVMKLLGQKFNELKITICQEDKV